MSESTFLNYKADYIDNLHESECSVLKVASLNVCGLRSKLLFPELSSMIQQYDILGFQKTKTDDLDDITFQDYT